MQSQILTAKGSCTVVEHSPHYAKIKGLSLAAAVGTPREKEVAKKIFFVLVKLTSLAN
jgi:hypothetical protein